MKKYILSVILLTLGMVVTGCAENAVELSTIAKPFSQNKKNNLGLIDKCEDYFGENVQAYERADGKKVIYLYSAPIEHSGNMIEEKEEYYSADGTYLDKTFPVSLSRTSPIAIDGEDDFARIYIDDNFHKAKFTKSKNVFSESRQAVVYKNAFGKGVDYVCSPTSFGVNTEIKISKRTDVNTFQIKIQMPNLVPDTDSPDYIAFKTALESGEVKSLVYTPVACDANGKWSYANKVTLIEKDASTNTYTVEYEVDAEFLKSKDTKYPVTLNQSIHLYKSKQPDTSAYENTGEEARHYLSPYILLGDSTIKGEGWTYVRYQTLDKLDIDPDKIVSAKYVFHNLFDLEKQTRLSAYAVTSDWCSINTRWFNRPPNDEKPISDVLIKDAGDYELDITPLFIEMIKNKSQETAVYSVQNSFMVKSDTQDSNVLISSGDNGLYSPMLEIVLSE